MNSLVSIDNSFNSASAKIFIHLYKLIFYSSTEKKDIYYIFILSLLHGKEIEILLYLVKLVYKNSILHSLN